LVTQQRAPAARPRITAAGTVSINHHIMFAHRRESTRPAPWFAKPILPAWALTAFLSRQRIRVSGTTRLRATTRYACASHAIEVIRLGRSIDGAVMVCEKNG